MMILNYKSSDEPLVFTSKIPKYKRDSLILLQNTFFLQSTSKYINPAHQLFGKNADIWLQYKNTENCMLPITYSEEDCNNFIMYSSEKIKGTEWCLPLSMAVHICSFLLSKSKLFFSKDVSTENRLISI